jgi:ATP synthase protein I
MPIIAPFEDVDALEAEKQSYKRLSKQEAQTLREQQPSTSPWRVIGLQLTVGMVVTLLAWIFTMKTSVAWSAAYGAVAVVIPAALFARGLMSQFSSLNAMTAGFGFFVWEAVKISVSVAMLFAAPKMVTDLDWLVMLISLIVTMKVYWVTLLMRPKSASKTKTDE